MVVTGAEPESAVVLNLPSIPPTEELTEVERLRAENEALRAQLAELQKVDEENRISLMRYQSLTDATFTIVWIAGPDGRSIDINEGWINFTGQDWRIAASGGWAAALHPDDRTNATTQWRKAVQAQAIFEVEYRLRHRSGNYRLVSVRGVPVFEDGKLREWVGTIHDIQDIRQAQQQLMSDEERWRFALEAANIGSWDADLSTDTIIWNEGHYRLFGLIPTNEPKRLEDYSIRIHPDDLPAVRANMAAVATDDIPFDVEYRVVWPNGKIIWCRSVGRAIERDEAGLAVRMVGILSDITAQKRAEEVLRQRRDEFEQLANQERQRADEARRDLLARQVETQEEERRRLSRELHDQMGQNLTAMMIGLNGLLKTVSNNQGEWTDVWIQQNTSGTPSVWSGYLRNRLETLQKLAEQMWEQTGRLAHELRPAALDNLGLASALDHLVAQWSEQNRIPAQFHALNMGKMDGEAIRLPAEIETALYRVVQEALTNVARHARATEVSVLLEKPEGSVLAIIEDDGCGFNSEVVAARGRLGIVGMKERMEAVGGELNIESEPGQHTTLFARVPLPSNNSAANSQ